MGKTKKAAAGKKRDTEEAAAAAAEQPKQKKAKAAAMPAKEEEHEEQPSSEEESDEGEFEEMSDEGEDFEEDGEPTAADLWQQQLHKRAEELDKFVCLLGNLDKEGADEDEESDDEEVTVEMLEAMTRLFLPKKAEGYLEELAGSLEEIGCTPPESEEEGDDADEDDETKEMKKMMASVFMVRGLSTRHSTPMQMLIKESLGQADKALKAKKIEEAFYHWVATLLAVSNEGHWYGDTEEPKVAENIYKQLKKQWGQIKKHSLEELGNPSCEGGKHPDVKKALDTMLEKLAHQMRGCDYDV